MRCLCCNRNLSDYESTLRHPVTNEFLDICQKCLKDIPIAPVEGASTDDHEYYEEDTEYIDECISYDDPFSDLNDDN